MRISTFFTLGLCVSMAHAQPNSKPAPTKAGVLPRVRPAEPAMQIEHDLREFAAIINGATPFPLAQKWIYGARTGNFGGEIWARETIAARKRGSEETNMQIHDIDAFKIEDGNASATLTYSFIVADFGVGREGATAFWRKKRKTTLQLKLGTTAGFGDQKVWQIVPPQKSPRKLTGDGLDTIWEIIVYILSQKENYLGSSKTVCWFG